MPLISEYIKKMGGYKDVSTALGVSQGTLASWSFRNVVNREYVPAFVKLAKKTGVAVDINFIITGKEQ